MLSPIPAAFFSARSLGCICSLHSHSHTCVKFLPFCAFNFLCRRCFTATIPLALQMLFGNPSGAIAFSDGQEFGTPSDFLYPNLQVMLRIYAEWREKDEGEQTPTPQQKHTTFSRRYQHHNKQINNKHSFTEISLTSVSNTLCTVLV